MKITMKILIPTAIMLLSAVAAVSIIGYTNIADEMDNVMRVTNAATLDEILLKIDSVEEETEILKSALNKNFLRITRSVAAFVDSRPEIPEQEALTDLAGRVGIEEIHIIGSDGVLFAGTNPGFYGFDFSTDEQTRPFLKMLEDKSFELAQEPQIRAVDQVLFQYIGVPLQSQKGLVQIGVQPKELQDLIESTSLQNILENYNYTSGAYAYIVSPDRGEVLYHSIPDRLGIMIRDYDFGQKIMEMRTGTFAYVFDNVEVFTSFREIPEGILITAVPTETYKESLGNVTIALIVTSLVSLIILMGIMIIVVRKIVSPLIIVTDSLKKIADGDLLIDIDSRLVGQKDEIGALATSLDFMTRNLREIVGKVSEAANYIASGSLQVSDSSQLLSNGATEQAASAEEVSSSMEEMNANISQNADNSKQTEKIAIKAAKDARDSGETVQQALDAMTMIAGKITIIEEISRSTNLLALNAAIEAARAGEQGKGFAVVASEVRKLAEQSQKAAGEITELASKTVALSKGSGEKLTKLVPDIERTAELVEEISAASNEQQSGVDQITSAIQQLDKIIQSNASSSEELASTSEELASQAEQLKETIRFFNITGNAKKPGEKKKIQMNSDRKKLSEPAGKKKTTSAKETGIAISPRQELNNNITEEMDSKIFDDDFESF